MDSRDDELIDEELKNRWLLECANGVRPDTKKLINASWCLEHGANVNTKDIWGNTPLHVAVRREDATLVDLLLKHHADINTTNNTGNTLLHTAAATFGKAPFIHLLLNSGADVNTANEDGDTPLHLAVYYKDLPAVDLLLKYGAHVNITNKDSQTPLHVAVRRGKKALVDILLKFGADVSITNWLGETPLYPAVRFGNHFLVDLLVNSGADVNVRNNSGDTPLHEVVRRGDASYVRQLLKFGADVNAKNFDGYSPIIGAVSSCNSFLVKLLVNSGADVNISCTSYESPLHEAVYRGDAYLVNQLLIYGAEVNTRGRWYLTPLHSAAELGNTSIMNQLLKYGGDVNTKNSDGDTLLHEAVDRGDATFVTLLMSNGADVNMVGRWNNTPLHVAVRRGEAFLTNQLLKYGAAINVTNSIGNTPLHEAVGRGNIPLVDFLLKYGADLNTKNNDGNTPLHTAAVCGFAPIIDLLLNSGGDVNSTNKAGNTPLHTVAATSGKAAIIDLLLNSGADVNMVNKDGNMPLHLAAACSKMETPNVELLLKYGADVNFINKAGNTPLHLAARQRHSHSVDLLLRGGADVTLRNSGLDTPLTVARVFNFEGNEEIVSLLETAEISAKNKTLPCEDRSQRACHKPTKNYLNNVQPGFKYSKRAGTSGVSGQLYQMKLLGLVLIRALNDDQIEHFLLGTDIHGIGDMDDICLRYQVKGQDRQVLLFVQTKHRENPDKGKLTVNEVRSTSGEFNLWKYFESYLMIKNRFQADNEDSMFKGDFGNVECNLIVYTPVKDCLPKKKNEQQLSEKAYHLINTGATTNVFQYDYNEDDIGYLTKMIAINRIKKLGMVFLELIMSEKDMLDMILVNKVIARHHVVMGREVLQQCKIQHVNEKYRIWKFRPDFFESDCKYLVDLKNTFIEELSTKPCDKSNITNEDRENLKLVIQDPCANAISKIIGKLVTYNYKKKRLQLVEDRLVEAIEEQMKQDKLQAWLKRINKIVIHESIINKAVQIKLTALKIILPKGFGNLDMTFRGSDAETEEKMKAVADKLIHLFERNKDSKIVDINEEVAGQGKIIERGISDVIKSAVGNVIVEDKNTKMLKFDLDNNSLPEKAALFLKVLKDDRYKPINEELSSFRIQINIEEFPKYSFNEDEYDNIQASDFLSKLLFFTNQAKENEVECILKNHINKYYNYDKVANNLLFEIHSNAIFLRSHDEIQKWWMQKGETPYLSETNDIYGFAKLACIDNILLTIIDYMHYFNIMSLDFQFHQHPILQHETYIEVPVIFSKILGKLIDEFDTQNKSVSVSIENKKDIVNLLQTAERLARDVSPSSNYQPQTSCNILKDNYHIVIPHIDAQNNAQQKCKYLKRGDTCGVSGQLYETKLLCLVFIRALNDEQIENFLLGTNICGIGDMDDICLRYRVRGQDRPVVLFVQAKHKDNPEKAKLTVEDVRSASGHFSIHKYFESYLAIKDRFQVDNEDPLFEGDFGDVECNLIIYTPVKDCFTKKKTERQVSEKVHYLINTGENTEVFQYDYDEDDIDYLTEITGIWRIRKLGIVFLKIIMSEKDVSDMILVDKLIARHHVVMGRQVLQQCKTQQEKKEYRTWKFRRDFFESDCKNLLALKRTFIRELSTKRSDKSKINNEDHENLKEVLRDPCASTISKVIGKLVIYNDKSGQLQLLEISNLKEKINNDEFKIIQKTFGKIVIDKIIISEAIRIKLTAMKIKLPFAFGNSDMTFRGSETKVRRRMKTVADKLIYLFEMNKNSKIVEISDDVVGPGKSVERGIVDINGGIGSAVGNILIIDANTKMLKLDVDNKELPVNAAMFLKEIKDDRYKPINEELSSYQIKINIDGFPKDSFNGDEFDKKQVRDYLNKLWFYTNQAKENEVELILKDEINKYYNNEIGQNRIYRNFANPIFLNFHDEIQKWWLQIDGSPYLSRASELFEHAELADIDNLLLTVINYMYISGVYRIDINIKQRVTDYSKFVKMHQTFNKMSGRLFSIFDLEFDQLIDIELPTETDRYFFSCELVFSLEIHPIMEWVALKLLAQRGFSYSLIAKAGPGSGCRRAKDGFLLKQSFDGNPIYFIDGEKDPLESIWR